MSSLDLLRLMIDDLSRRQADYEKLDEYYSGDQPLAYLHPDVVRRVGNRLQSVVINWPRIAIGAVEERLDVEGFRAAATRVADDRLWSWWQANDLDEWSQLAHTDALLHGRAFASVWTDEDREEPVIACESAREMTVRYKPGMMLSTLEAALKVWVEGDETDFAADRIPDDLVTHAVLYLPDRIERYATPGSITAGIATEWKSDGPIVANPIGEVPIVPLVNRPRLRDLAGESEIADIIPPADAINKLATDMMVSSEYTAMRRRWIAGLEKPREGASKDRFTEEVRAQFAEAFPGDPWIGGAGVEFGQFDEASLENFERAIKLFQSNIAALGGLPPHYVGLQTDNPASADAIRSAESSLVKKAERKQRGFGGSWERVMRLAVAVTEGSSPRDLDRLETVWRDPATPTPAQKADAVVKLTQVDRPIITLRQAREDLGYTPTQIDRMERDEARNEANAATATVRAQVDLAERLMVEQNLDQKTAFAAVGLIVASQQIGTYTSAFSRNGNGVPQEQR